MDTPGHLLSLKVMRVSRPSLASSWQPFFTSSPSFSAHATESVLSLQGKEPLPGHPKTLRDLTHASQFLTLPSSFGAIQLGETFTSCLCVNNEANMEVDGVSLRIEMQTATNKAVLAEVGGPDHRLTTKDVLEAIVSHEMKELGQHVLACYVSYRLPSSVRTPPGPADDPEDPSLQTFRKYYKFAVTNPLNVKTKVHAPRSPTALLSRSEREKIFLEIHVQNLTQEPMWFERMRFECVDGWQVKDGNISQQDGKSLFSDSMAIMQPQDTRQYVYILTPTSIPTFPIVYPPGTIIPLGRLDLSWRSSFGEPGRLLTSLLTRRIPIPPAQAAASALPPHIQRASTPARPHSPQQTISRPSTPPGSTGSFKPRPPSQQIGRPQSPAPVIPPSPTPPALQDLEVDLVVHSIPHSDIRLERPFVVVFELTLSGILPAPTKARIVHLALQHTQPSRGLPPPTVASPTTGILSRSSSPRPSIDVLSPKPLQVHNLRRESDTPTENPSPIISPRRGGSFAHGVTSSRATPESPVVNHDSETSHSLLEHPTDITGFPHPEPRVRLPPPFSPSVRSSDVRLLGASAIFLPPIQLTRPPLVTPIPGAPGHPTPAKGEVVHQFECTFIPMRRGFVNVGGMRILLVEDREIDEGQNDNERPEELTLIPHASLEAKVVREWDVVAEVWIPN